MSGGGDRLEAVFHAGRPGRDSVAADFEVACSSEQAPPCTIPPIARIALTVVVVA
jgi:hypothetical protein